LGGLPNKPAWINNNVMGKSWRLPAFIANILLVAGLAIIWMAFAPAKLGGQVSYVLVNGISMEPNYHTGDLVLVRQASEYRVEDIVTYHDAEMNADVIHRIISIQGDHFVLKGDNNSWIDEYKPTRAEIAGKMWLHLPGFGVAVLWIKSPINIALAAGLLGGFFMVDMTLQKPNKNGKKKNKAAGNPAGGMEMALYLFGILALGFVALSIFAFSRPTLRTADKIQYEQTGNFYYSAASTPGVYDTDSVRSGEPVFTKLTCKINLEFVYFLTGEQLENISGSEQFHATLLDQQSGWKRTIYLAQNKNFSGNIVTNTATLNLCQIQALVASVGQKTGIRLNTYTIVIAAPVSVSGKISGQKFTDTFEPQLTFNFDSLHFYIAGDSSKTNPLQTVQNGSLSSSAQVENTITLLGLNFTIQGIRILAIFGLIISLAGLLALGLIFNAASKYSQNSGISLKYGSILMDVYDQRLENLSPIIEVTSIESLAKLAERQNAMIMHLIRGFVHYYFIQIEGTTYRYVNGKD
jgi:signal peptidase I